jgi:hypothetical protein
MRLSYEKKVNILCPLRKLRESDVNQVSLVLEPSAL